MAQLIYRAFSRPYSPCLSVVSFEAKRATVPTVEKVAPTQIDSPALAS